VRTQVLLNPNGSGGDVYPFLAVGQQLQRLGHHVGVMTNPHFKPQVGQAGLEFISVGLEDDLKRVGQGLQADPKSPAWKLALRWTARSAKEVVDYLAHRRLRYPTLLVGSPLSFGMRLVAEKYAVPMATLILSPFVLRSVSASPCMPPLWLDWWMPWYLKSWQYWAADHWAIDRELQPVLGPLRRQLGLPARRRFMHRWCFSPDLNLGCFPDWFAPPQPDWPPGFHHVGPVHWDPWTHDPAATDALWIWAERLGQKPVAILAGSAGPPSAEFYRSWIAASASQDRGLIILEQDLALLPPILPSHVRVLPYLSLDRLLPHVSALIHSGSIGASLRSAAAGVPQLIFPRFNDQFDNARRVQRWGLGMILQRREITDLKWRQAASLLDRLLMDVSIQQHCQQVAMRPHGSGVNLAAEQIDAFFRRQCEQT
jgi:rhamnosyltransferase subunit B